VTSIAWAALAVAALLAAPSTGPSARLPGLAHAGRLAVVNGAPHGRAVALAPLRLGAGFVVAAVATVLLMGGLLLAAATAAAGGVGWLLCRDAVRRREAAAARAELRAAVRALISELEAGAQAPAALRAAAAVAPRYAGAFTEAAAVARRAGDAGGVLVADPCTRVIGLAWRLGIDSGVALVGVLGTVAADLHAADEQRRCVETALSGARASAVLLSGLPLVGIVLGVAMGARPQAVLTGSTAGQALCCVGVLLDAAGALWMRRILARAARL
jgi:tight adherence protein B